MTFSFSPPVARSCPQPAASSPSALGGVVENICLCDGNLLSSSRFSWGLRFRAFSWVVTWVVCPVNRAASRLFNSGSLRVGKAPAALMAYSAGCHPSLPRTAGVGGPELCPASPQIHQSKVVVPNPERYICSPFPSVSVFRRASSSGELRCMVRERCIALPGRGLTFCHGNVAWVNRLERPETVRLPLAFAFWSTSWAPCHSPCPRS